MDPDIDDLELIKMVEQQPCLYAKSCRAYKDINKPTVWAQIGALLTHQKTGIFIKIVDIIQNNASLLLLECCLSSDYRQFKKTVRSS